MTACSTRTIAAFLLVLLAGPGAAGEPGHGRVTLTAQAPRVTLPGVPAERRFIDLPSLEYAFEIEAECDGGVPHSLSVAVADTRATLSESELAAGPARLVLRVPAKQTPPLAIDGFCTAPPAAPGEASADAAAPGPDAGPSPSLEVPGVLSAQVALVCRDGEARHMSWFSRALDVTLACEPPAGGTVPPPADR
ncbi:MAG TPA: hypothetical protein VKZ85_16000 [Woeseiaceae bacterium]|nr:hypothetical protein [Woeseiaceae bacterium]